MRYLQDEVKKASELIRAERCCCCKGKFEFGEVKYEVSKEKNTNLCSHCVQYYLASSKDELKKFIAMRKIMLGKTK